MRIAKFMQSPAGTILRYALSATLLCWLATQVDWQRFAALGDADPFAFLPAALLAGAAYPLQAWRWQLLLRTQGCNLPASWVHGVTWIGQFYNSFLPGGVAGDAVRLGYCWRAAPDRRAAAAASLLTDRLLGLGSLCILAALALGMHLFLHGGGAELRHLLASSVTATALLLAASWSLVATRWWEPVSARLLGRERATALHDATQVFGSRRGVLAAASLISVAVWLVDFASLWLLAGAVGLVVDPLTLTVAAAAAYVAAALPISIGGHGLREGALVVVLGWMDFTIAANPAVPLLAVGLWALSVGWSIMGGIVWLTGPQRAPSTCE